MMQTDVLAILQERGFVANATDLVALGHLLREQSVVVYTGYDPTANSLHVGNLLTLMAFKHFQQAGHRVLIILGGATALVGDPSGKTEARPMLLQTTIQDNKQALQQQIATLLQNKANMVQFADNAEWLLPLSYIDFLRDIGRHFSVNRMLTAEAYKQRLARGLSFLEFNYQMLQAYDFLQLLQRYNCQLQLGGDDQWGNILAGVDLCRRVEGKTVFGLTYPLLTLANGQKMGKTTQGSLWLDANKCSPYDFYQYWVNIDDADVRRFLSLFTLLPMSEIRQVESLHGSDYNLAKSILAYEVTAVVHGVQKAQEVHLAAQSSFGGRVLPVDLLPTSQVPRQLQAPQKEHIPTTLLPNATLEKGILWVDVLLQAGLAPSKAQARRLIEQGGVKINDVRLSDPLGVCSLTCLVNQELIIRVGKKQVHRIACTDV